MTLLQTINVTVIAPVWLVLHRLVHLPPLDWALHNCGQAITETELAKLKKTWESCAGSIWNAIQWNHLKETFSTRAENTATLLLKGNAQYQVKLVENMYMCRKKLNTWRKSDFTCYMLLYSVDTYTTMMSVGATDDRLHPRSNARWNLPWNTSYTLIWEKQCKNTCTVLKHGMVHVLYLTQFGNVHVENVLNYLSTLKWQCSV